MVARRKESHQKWHEHKVVHGIQGLVRRFPTLFFLRQPRMLRGGAERVGEGTTPQRVGVKLTRGTKVW